MFYLAAAGAGDGLWRLRDREAFDVWKSSADSMSEPAAVAPDGSRVAVMVRQEGKLRLSVMSADGTGAQTVASSLTLQPSGGFGIADWSPDGKWIAAAAADVQGAGLFKIPVEGNGNAPVRLTPGAATTPVFSPDGRLIVYGGAVVGGRIPLLAVTPDGVPVTLPQVRERLGGGHRFLPDGRLIYLPHGQALDFWVLDLATKSTYPVTHLANHGVLRSFDITPDGQSIVFGRSVEKSDVVLIELPKN
jgi:Tol biopolymer transport system component